jgi:predicted O-methyltransferase YrrM
MKSALGIIRSSAQAVRPIMDKSKAREQINQIFRERFVYDDAGGRYPLNAEVDHVEGEFLYQLISRDSSVVKTLEIGCAYGLSSLFICDALLGRAGASHMALDPYQTGEWHGVGAANLKRAEIRFASIVERKSEIGLAELLEHNEGSFDFILIDGLHTFDQTMLDLYYANRLVKVGGYIAVDDCHAPPVAKAVSCLERFPCYRKLASCPEQVTFRRRAKRVIRKLLPVAAAQWLLPARVYDAVYTRTMYPSMLVLQKTSADLRDVWWFRSF